MEGYAEVIGLGTVLVPLARPRITRKVRIAGALWNRVLMLTFLPMLIMGGSIAVTGDFKWHGRSENLFLAYLIGLGSGLLFHELSHAAACLGYGGKLKGMGVMSYLFMPGAYVEIDYKRVKNRFKRAQINAAGVEMNFWLVGFFSLMLKTNIGSSFVWVYAAVINMTMGIFNLSMSFGLDGMNIFKELFGSMNLVSDAVELTLTGYGKQELKRKGITGRATIVACYVISCFQLLLPLLIITNLLAMILSIFGL